jgi:hypothetical protein
VEATNSKLQYEYTRPSPNQRHSAPAASHASSSSSPPQSYAQARSLNASNRTSPLPSANKQKQGNFGWLDGNAGGIMQDEDPHPPMTATQNAGRPPSCRPGAQLQVQVGPRPHDVLAQPQSPVSDPDDDVGGAALDRAPTYHPVVHPRHARTMNDRQQVQNHASRESLDSARSGRSDSMDLPAWTAVAPSLEGPAYEEVDRTASPANPANRRAAAASPAPAPVPAPAPTPAPAPVPAPANDRRQSRDWRPVQAKPQAQERVGGARRSTGAPVSGPTNSATSPAQQWSSSPNTYAASSPATAYIPGGYAPAPAGAPRPGLFDPRVAYQPTQPYTLAGRTDTVVSGHADAQQALREAGANAFYKCVPLP